MWLTVISLWQSGVRSGNAGNIVRENVATVLFFKDTHLVGGKAVGTRGPRQGVQVGDAVPARQALGWNDQLLAVQDLGTGDVRRHDTRTN
jgi:hypothetical protein